MDNPQAFPVIKKLNNSTMRQNDPDYYVESSQGMTLRDYFAGQALIGLVQLYPVSTDNAEQAYLQAGLMLKERSKEEDDE